MKTIYKTQVVEIGLHVDSFQRGDFIILYGPDVPEELRDYRYGIEIKEIESKIAPGQYLILGDKTYQITAVGDEVMDTLARLGHCTIRFNGSTSPQMPGTIYVEKSEVPSLEVGTLVQIMEETND